MLIPIAFRHYDKKKEVTVLAGDIGGTKINMALYRFNETGFTLLRQDSYHSKDYTSLKSVIQQFAGSDPLPDTICLAVAGPVIKGNVKITNLPWQLDSQALSDELGKNLVFINDLEANAYGLAGLNTGELYNLCEGDPGQGGNMAILAPGTGLGEAGLYWDGNCYHPFATEGGHSAFASRTALDFELYNWLAGQYKFICWEHVISGMGIQNIFRFLTEGQKKEIPGWLKQEMETEDHSAVISEHAIDGKSELCMETMDLFLRYLATESSSLVLKYKATGGLYLGGGIPPKILPLLQKNKWQQLFFESDRMETLLKKTPVNVILNDKIPLLGAAYYAAYSFAGSIP